MARSAVGDVGDVGADAVADTLFATGRNSGECKIFMSGYVSAGSVTSPRSSCRGLTLC
jgi:hypothetical protein